MRFLITGICGFVGNAIAKRLLETVENCAIYGIDNLIRQGSELNRGGLLKSGVRLFHGDIRQQSDFDAVPQVDWVIDAAANPSVLAGVDGRTSSRQLIEHNLFGTVNMLEYCKRAGAGFILLSTSRVYSIKPLSELQVEVRGQSFRLKKGVALPDGLTESGVTERFSTTAPVSLYGSTKLASEITALEYGETFDFPVWINRCGVLAGAGQFGRPDQGIFSFWINSYLRRRPLKYIGFGGNGYQVRDAIHPRDLVPVLLKQMSGGPSAEAPKVCNFGGGIANAISLAELSEWCKDRFGPHEVANDPTPRPFDIPWMVMDSTLAHRVWGWKPQVPIDRLLSEIAVHAGDNPDWLEISGAI
ncbi:MAG: NAD-dependent epimerase/dehydratase family protein [Deltaproteobacteria bacterium]|nr:NAD-dependent epimerase/dehydratase family protein [Deltaproteobacteria bacterium]